MGPSVTFKIKKRKNDDLNFQSQIWVRNLTKNSEFVRGDSINQVTTFGVLQGDKLAIASIPISLKANSANLLVVP